MEVGIPVNSAVSKNTEFVPKVFNDLRVGETFHRAIHLRLFHAVWRRRRTAACRPLNTVSFSATAIEHRQLPLPGVQQFIPMFELVGETRMNQDDPGQNSLLGNAAFRVNLKTIGRVQPRLGLGFVFPMNSNARADVHCGVVTSLVFEY